MCQVSSNKCPNCGYCNHTKVCPRCGKCEDCGQQIWWIYPIIPPSIPYPYPPVNPTPYIPPFTPNYGDQPGGSSIIITCGNQEREYICR